MIFFISIMLTLLSGLFLWSGLRRDVPLRSDADVVASLALFMLGTLLFRLSFMVTR